MLASYLIARRVLRIDPRRNPSLRTRNPLSNTLLRTLDRLGRNLSPPQEFRNSLIRGRETRLRVRLSSSYTASRALFAGGDGAFGGGFRIRDGRAGGVGEVLALAVLVDGGLGGCEAGVYVGFGGGNARGYGVGGCGFGVCDCGGGFGGDGGADLVFWGCLLVDLVWDDRIGRGEGGDILIGMARVKALRKPRMRTEVCCILNNFRGRGLIVLVALVAFIGIVWLSKWIEMKDSAGRDSWHIFSSLCLSVSQE